jgi:hypothetical protein
MFSDSRLGNRGRSKGARVVCIGEHQHWVACAQVGLRKATSVDDIDVGPTSMHLSIVPHMVAIMGTDGSLFQM